MHILHQNKIKQNQLIQNNDFHNFER
uniref:Uncharacterized protein n=1 Tax=Rhizophora mucronata TaxID=61149 RepID=A0A2P2NQJ4_RHIMU